MDQGLLPRQSLTLDETALAKMVEAKRAVFVYEWLRYLDQVLPTVARSEIKDKQKVLVGQLLDQIRQGSLGPPSRVLAAQALTTLFRVGDTFLLFDTINKCNDWLKNKDDSPSFLPTRLGAICVLGHMYETLGRMTGRSYEETVQVLNKGLKNAESQIRMETMVTFGKVCEGLGTAASNIHRDIYKSVRSTLTDRAHIVRAASAQCLLSMSPYATFVSTTELENVATMCFRAFEGANYETRKVVAKCLGTILANTQQEDPYLKGRSSGMMIQRAKKGPSGNNANKPLPLGDVLAILMQGFLKGGSSGSGLIKGGSTPVSQDVRVGVTHCYVILVQTLGPQWLEKNLNQLLNHILELASHPKAATSHVDAVYSRRCVGHVIQVLLGKMLSEQAQMAACKEMIAIVEKIMSSLDVHSENTKDSSNQETLFSQHLIVVALQELGTLFQRLGTVSRTLIMDHHLHLTNVLCSLLLHPSQAPRLAASWCLRCLCVASPSHLTPILDRCLEGLEKLKASADAVSGYSSAIAALLGAVRLTPLGIPHTRGKIAFNVGEDLLRSASQNSRLSKERTQAGWLLIGSVMTLGPAVVKGLLPRMMLLWRNAFPRSQKELESEKSRGDAFTWRVSLEARCGAMSAIHAFLLLNGNNGHISSELVNDDTIRRLSVPVEACLNLCSNLGSVLRSYPTELKALAAMLRLRLFETISLLPPGTLEANYTQLLRLLVAEFTLSDGNSTSTSLLRSFCHTEDSVILGTRFQDAEEIIIEEQLLANSASGSGALEHDLCSLFRPLGKDKLNVPGPLPLGVSVVDQSIIVFGLVFPRVAQKHRLQMLDHFSEHIKQQSSKSAKNAPIAEAIQMNIFTAVLSSLKGLVEAKTKLAQEDVKKAAVTLIIGALTSTNPMLRCAAGEALGRMAQVVADPKFVAEMAQSSFDCLKSARDVTSRTGHSLALGCLHRYVGGMGSSQHLHTSVSILLALAQDQASPQVQVWALHALALIADSGGPMFRGFVEPTLSTILKLLLSVQLTSLEVMSCLGRVLSALITTVGPELQSNSNEIAIARSSFLCAVAMLQNHPHPVVQAEAIQCLQQLHMFAQPPGPSRQGPAPVDLAVLVPILVKYLRSSHLILRQSAVSCLRQFAQREAKEVCEQAMTLINQESLKETHNLDSLHFTDSGLPGILFSILDHELDPLLLSNIHDTLLFIMQSMASENLTSWLSLLREVLTIRTDDSGTNHPVVVDDENDDNDDGDDDEDFKIGEESREALQPRWPTRVFAAECLRRIIEDCCQGNRAHFDLCLAKEMQMTQAKGDYLVLHLSELVRVAFMAATSDSDPLRLEGLRTMQVIIEKFGDTPEPEFPGHVILEQYQAQVGAALRPAFTPETPSHVTAAACNVCSSWIGSGVARDLSDLRRVYQLLVSSLDKIKPKSTQAQFFNESALTLEKLSILKGWAEVYIMSMKNEILNFSSENPSSSKFSSDDDDDFAEFDDQSTSSGSKNEGLAALVQEELPSLSKHWLAAMKDYALLSLPSEFKSQLPHDGGAFYTNDTIESARPHYRATWPPILEAAAIWLTYGQGFENVQKEKSDLDVQGSANLGIGPANAAINKNADDINKDRFYLLFGICMEALSNNRSADLSKEEVSSCLKALKALLDYGKNRRDVLYQDPKVLVELCNALHRTVLTRDNVVIQTQVMHVIHLVLKAAKEHLDQNRKKKQKELSVPVNQEPDNLPELDLLGEGGESGKISPESSVVFATLEVGLCVLVRHYPDLSPRAANINSVMAMQAKSRLRGRLMNEEQCQLIALAIQALSTLTKLCSPKGALKVLPSIYWLITGVLKEAASKAVIDDGIVLASNPQVTSSLQGLRALTSSNYAQDERSRKKWAELSQSTLLSLVDLAKTAPNEDQKMDETSLLLAVAVFILNCDPSVVCSPNIQYPAINAFSQAFQSSNAIVRLKCVQTLQSIFRHPKKQISLPYIHSLLPKILEHLMSESARAVKTDEDFLHTTECLRIVESLMMSLPDQGKKAQLLALHVPILVSQLLLDGDIKDATQLRLRLHENALNKLTQLGKLFPQEIRAIFTQHVELKTRLETAIRINQARVQNAKHEAANAALNAQQRKVQDHTPSIKLTMDFSKFAAK